SEFEMEVGTFDRHASDEQEEVDARLVRLARAMGAELVTNDVNLNRVAQLQNIKVLNLNDLAMALKPNVLPRESLNLLIAREGNQQGQGIGYLEDGTMVVVENGRNRIGETVRVMVTQVIQTERGKMIFAELPDGPIVDTDADSSRRSSKRRTDA
ncbi:MAG: TRAM domain-containing protein, partial [Chthonomonas sp.]|nr:TRAM domain-containing protein [Chthonomonas sp.]